MPAKIHSEFFSGAHFEQAYSFAAAPASWAMWSAGSWHSRFELLDAASGIDERLFAQLSATVVLHNGSSFLVAHQGGIQEINESVIIGPHTQPVLFHHRPDNHLSGIKLKPGGFYQLSGIPAELLRDQIIPLKELLQVRGKIQLQQFPALLQEYGYTADKYRYDCVQRALEYYVQHITDNPGLEYIARQLLLTPKTLQRYFREALGVNPRKAFSIVRIRMALQAAAADPGFSIYHYGYTDNSHFYKELRQYTSLPSLKQY